MITGTKQERVTNETYSFVGLKATIQNQDPTHNMWERLPKYDPQSEPYQANIEKKKLDFPPLVTPWPNQNRDIKGSLRSGRDTFTFFKGRREDGGQWMQEQIQLRKGHRNLIGRMFEMLLTFVSPIFFCKDYYESCLFRHFLDIHMPPVWPYLWTRVQYFQENLPFFLQKKIARNYRASRYSCWNMTSYLKAYNTSGKTSDKTTVN